MQTFPVTLSQAQWHSFSVAPFTFRSGLSEDMLMVKNPTGTPGLELVSHGNSKCNLTRITFFFFFFKPYLRVLLLSSSPPHPSGFIRGGLTQRVVVPCPTHPQKTEPLSQPPINKESEVDANKMQELIAFAFMSRRSVCVRVCLCA